jgi:hypothetical protein
VLDVIGSAARESRIAAPGTRLEDYAALPREARLARLARTADRLADALARRAEAPRARRPAPSAWAPVEVICHLRDSEEWFLVRCRLALAMDEPPFPRNNPDRWAHERQYLRHDADEAVAAFRRWREETRALFAGLPAGAWARGGVHLDGRGRRTVDEFLSVIAWHDANHLDQLQRALEGRP